MEREFVSPTRGKRQVLMQVMTRRTLLVGHRAGLLHAGSNRVHKAGLLAVALKVAKGAASVVGEDVDDRRDYRCVARAL